MALANADDVSSRLGRELEDTEAQIVEIRLDDAELIIRSRIRDLDEKIEDGDILEEAVKMVEADAVLRLIRNPEGFIQEADGNYSYMIDAKVASGRLSILPDEWALLGIRQATFTIKSKVDFPTGAGSPWGPNIDQWWFPTGDDEAVWAD